MHALHAWRICPCPKRRKLNFFITNTPADLFSKQQDMSADSATVSIFRISTVYSKNTIALNQITPSKAKNRTQIFTNINLAFSANHKSNYSARFYAKKPELITRKLNDQNC